MDKVIDVAKKLGITAWVGLWGGVAFGILLFTFLSNLELTTDLEATKGQLARLEADLERNQTRVAELENELIQLTGTLNGSATGRQPGTTISNRTRDDICERSPSLQQELLDEVFSLPTCSMVSSRDLLTVTELSISQTSLKTGDLDGFENLDTLRLYLGKRPPNDLLTGVRGIKHFLLEYPAGYCGGYFRVNGIQQAIYESGSNCRLSIGDP